MSKTVDFRCVEADIQRSSPTPIPASPAFRYHRTPAEQSLEDVYATFDEEESLNRLDISE
jgi:hypothetical protein